MVNPPNEIIPQFNILVLGTSGSGKTSFLASMYDILSLQRPEIGFFVHVPDNERKLLVYKYRMMKDPKKDWPPGTFSVKEWVFTCAMQRKSATRNLAKYVYVDYPGGDLTRPDQLNNSDTDMNKPKPKGSALQVVETDDTSQLLPSTDVFKASDSAKQADAILVLLDGLKLYHFMRGTSKKLSITFDDDLRYIAPVVQNNLNKPVHFVITKWDILEKKYKLQQIRDALFRDQHFFPIVAQRRENGSPTRLIPVSAVGKNFASLMSDEVTMAKNPQGGGDPFQVEIPICCVLIDDLKIVEKSLTDEERMKILRRKSVFSKILSFLTKLTKTTTSYLPLSNSLQLAPQIMGVLLDMINQGVNLNQEFIDRQIAGLKEKISAEEEAFLSLMVRYALLIKKLDTDFPESNLLI